MMCMDDDIDLFGIAMPGTGNRHTLEQERTVRKREDEIVGRLVNYVFTFQTKVGMECSK
jgi:hypothetical protein